MRARCPNCWTVFRATQEQLSARAGRVRCGQCHEVFNALGNLLDEEDETPPVVPGAEQRKNPPVFVPAELKTETQPEFLSKFLSGEETEDFAPSTEFDPPMTAFTPPESPEELPEESPSFAGERADLFEPEAFVPDEAREAEKSADMEEETEEIRDILLEEAPPLTPTGDAAETGEAATKNAAKSRSAGNDGNNENGAKEVQARKPEPSSPDEDFLNREMDGLLADATQAESFLARSFGYSDKTYRRFKWMGVCLGALLLFQAVGHFRGEIARVFPLFRPPLELLSNALGARIPLPRHAQMIDLEISDLQKDSERGLLLLEALLRNRANYGQAYPSLELSLTDANDKVVIRRVFEPGDYLPLKLSLRQPFGANADINIRLWIEVLDVQPVGYRLEVIYP